MTTTANTRELLLSQLKTYPQLQIEDIFKFLYQSAFGCEHLLPEPEAAAEFIRKEAEGMAEQSSALVEALDGPYCRVSLAYLRQGLSPETLAKLLCLSAVHEPKGKAALLEKLDAAKALVRDALLPFTLPEFLDAVAQWESRGFSPLHHSETFRQTYHPAYRLIGAQYVPFLPVLADLDRRLAAGPVIFAIEGGSASGKTTLSQLLEKLYDCTVFHMDDFFLRPEQRTPERYAEPGGNIDRERFLEEVLLPLRRGQAVNYRRFDCATFTLLPPETIVPKKLTVIEGAYCMHPDLAGFYDLSLFMETSPELQEKRIHKRNSLEMAQRFFTQWIPLEHRYFDAFDVKARCDYKINIENQQKYHCLFPSS